MQNHFSDLDSYLFNSTVNGEVVGSILCGHDGRTACFYHVCVREDCRKHGIGKEMHEDPAVPNYGKAGHGPKLQVGMVLAIEPMVNLGTWQTLEDGWKCVTLDGKPSAHYENTVALTENGAEILTL